MSIQVTRLQVLAPLALLILGSVCADPESDQADVTSVQQAVLEDRSKGNQGYKGDDGSARVTPVLTCVDVNADKTFTAQFTFKLEGKGKGTVEIPIGPLNFFHSRPSDRGQPTKFKAGKTTSFAVKSNEPLLIWVLDGQLVVASADARPCHPPPPTCPSTCDDHNACTADECSAATGWKCKNASLADGVSCEDGNVCNGVETCRGGSCQAGSPAVCADDGNSCTIESCVATGCASKPGNDGGACVDGSQQAGTCSAGACVVVVRNQPPVNAMANGFRDFLIPAPGGGSGAPAEGSFWFGAVENTISVSDPDAGGQDVEVTLLAAGGGIFELHAPAIGVRVTSTSEMIVLEGSVTAVNLALQSLSFRAAPGTYHLTMRTSDLGHSGEGGAREDIDRFVVEFFPFSSL